MFSGIIFNWLAVNRYIPKLKCLYSLKGTFGIGLYLKHTDDKAIH